VIVIVLGIIPMIIYSKQENKVIEDSKPNIIFFIYQATRFKKLYVWQSILFAISHYWAFFIIKKVKKLEIKI